MSSRIKKRNKNEIEPAIKENNKKHRIIPEVMLKQCCWRIPSLLMTSPHGGGLSLIHI